MAVLPFLLDEMCICDEQGSTGEPGATGAVGFSGTPVSGRWKTSCPKYTCK